MLFSLQLFKNDTVKQHEIHLSVTWGDAEQESGSLQKTIWFVIF